MRCTSGVKIFVADNPDEVRKFEPYRDQAELLLRVSFRSPGAVCRPVAQIRLRSRRTSSSSRAWRASSAIPVRGLSFHVGSQARGCRSSTSRPSRPARKLMAQARREKLGTFDTLDIGGGYPIEYGQKVADIGRFCAPIRAALAKLPARLRVIAEPGRYICGPAAIGVASVMGRARREGHWWYYLDDGLYGSYSGQLFDHAKYPVESLKEGDEKFPSVLAGPDLRQHRRDRREPDAAGSSRPAISSSAAPWAPTPGPARRNSTSSRRPPWFR